jgi:hypothetical protein
VLTLNRPAMRGLKFYEKSYYDKGLMHSAQTF